MRLATFTDATLESRFGVVRGERVFDVVALAGALGKPVPATSVKDALTRGGRHSSILPGWWISRPNARNFSPDRRGQIPAADSGSVEILLRRQEQQAAPRGTRRQQDADGSTERADRIHQIDRHHVGRRRRGGEACRYHKTRLRAGALLCDRQARPWRQEGRRDGLHRRLYPDQRHQRPRNPAARGSFRQPVLDRQEHAGFWRRSARTS